jgi:hypothetical protein
MRMAVKPHQDFFWRRGPTTPPASCRFPIASVFFCPFAHTPSAWPCGVGPSAFGRLACVSVRALGPNDRLSVWNLPRSRGVPAMEPEYPSNTHDGRQSSADPHAYESENQVGHGIGPLRRNRLTEEKTGRPPNDKTSPRTAAFTLRFPGVWAQEGPARRKQPAPRLKRLIGRG